MAKFNPDVQTGYDPNYLGFSRGVDVPENLKPRGQEPNTIYPKGQEIVDKSAAIGTLGLGELIKGGVQEASRIGDMSVKIVEDSLKNKIEDKVEQQRNAFINDLQTVSGTPSLAKAGIVAGSETPINPAFEDAYNAADVPEEVQNSGAKTAVFRQGASKASQTYYLQRLNTYLKDLRDQYPGFRSFIDRTSTQAAGTNVANALVRSHILDINRQAMGQNSELNKTLNDIRTHIGYDKRMPQLYDDVASGRKSISEANRMLYSILAPEVTLRLNAAIRADMKGNREEAEVSASSDVNNITYNSVNKFMNAPFEALGKSPNDVLKMAAEGKIPDEFARTFGTQLAQGRHQLYQSVWDRLNQKDPKTHRSIIDDAGGVDKVKPKVNDVFNLLDQQISYITDNNIGPALASKHFADDKVNSTKAGMLRNVTIGDWVAKTAAVDGLMPNFSKEWFQHAMGTNVPEAFRTYFLNDAMDLSTQKKFKDTGTPTTLKEVIDRASKTKQTEDGPPVATPKYLGSVFDWIDRIGDKSGKVPDSEKENLIRSVFDPNNYGMLAQFELDGVDPVAAQKGVLKKSPGKYSIYSRLTSDAYTNEIRRIAQTKPEMWEMYKDWAYHSFGQDLIQPELNALNKLQLNKDMRLTWNSNNLSWGVDWGANTNINLQKLPLGQRMGLYGPTSGYGKEYTPGEVYQTSQAINRLNGALQGLGRIAKAEGSNPEAFVLDTMIKFGFDPLISKPAGIPDQMIQALTQQRKFKLLQEQSKQKEYSPQ